MSIEQDVREIRRMFADHITNENAIFTANAQEHGVILTKLETIEKRLEAGTLNFDDHEDRIQNIEKTISNAKGWIAAIVFATGVMVKAFSVLYDKFRSII